MTSFVLDLNAACMVKEPDLGTELNPIQPVVFIPNAEQCACLQRLNMKCLTNGKNRNQLIPRWPGCSPVPWTDVGLPFCFRATRGHGHRNLRCPGKCPRRTSVFFFFSSFLRKIITLETLSLWTIFLEPGNLTTTTNMKSLTIFLKKKKKKQPK